MKLFLHLILPVLALPAMAQFGPPVQIATDVVPLWHHDRIEAVDMDDDGGLDLVFLRGGDLVWARNLDGAGNFGLLITLHTPVSLFAVGDIDGDGDPDVVFAGPTGQVAWMPNADGLGSFGAALPLETVTQAHALLCTDLNGDGLPDMAFMVDNAGDATVQLHINTGGSFLGPMPVPCGTGGPGLRLLHGDMDLDGHVDLVALDGNGVLHVLLNDGGGVPGWAAVVAGNTVPEAKLQLIDVDDDGDLDMILSHLSYLQWGENTSSPGAMAPLALHDIGEGNDHFAHAARLGCGPGVALLHYQGFAGNMFWKLFDPTFGTFITPTPNTLIVGAAPGLATTADLNGDGQADIIHAGPGGGILSWYANNLPAAPPEIVLQPFDTLCASGTSYPLNSHASPAGGSWSGPGVAGNVFTPSEAGSFTLTYTAPCAATASQLITVIDGPVITLVSGDPAIPCATDPLVYSASPAGGTWGGVAGVNGIVARDCRIRPGGGMVVYTYTSANGECMATAGFIDLSMECLPIDLGPDTLLCLSSDTLVVALQGPSQGSATLTGCDQTVFTAPSSVTGYFVPANHAPGQYAIIGKVVGGGYCPGTDTLVVTLSGSGPCQADCNGEFGGTAYLDNCNACVGGSTGAEPCEADCNGEFGGTAYLDNCNECVGGSTGEEPCVADCNGEFGGTAYLDNCNECVGGSTGQAPCEADCNGEFGGTAYFDNCNECVGGSTGTEPCEADCNGEFGGTAYLDNCNECVGGSTGLEPCEADCNGEFGGTAYLDNCNECVGGSTGAEPCEADCNGEFGGIAYLDNCDECVGGSTGEEPCVADCNGEFGGTAYLDNCNECVGGSTGQAPCVADCNGEFGGTAYLDNCNACVGGSTGAEPCEADCNGEFGGTAYLDNCNECVGGSTGAEPCEADCNGEFGGTAYLDNCNECVGGSTGAEPCQADCNGEFGGTAYLDNCNECVGGSTGAEPCEADCNGEFGGTAYLDNCNECVGGSTGAEPCQADCNGEFGGTAYLDNCNACVGGSTGAEPCVADCNGEFGGTAYLDNCNTCVGGSTGAEPCQADCNGEFGGTAYLDNCNECVGGNTGEVECVSDCNGTWGGSAFLLIDNITMTDTVVYVGDSAHFAVSVTPVVGASYNWTFPSEWTTNDPASATLHAMVGGPPYVTDTICVEVMLGTCVTDTCIIVQVNGTVGIVTTEGGITLTIFPNPSSGVFTLLPGTEAPVEYHVLNALGQHVRPAIKRSGPFTLDLSNLAAGSYLLRWSSTGANGQRSLLIQH